MTYRGITTETTKIKGHNGDEIEAYIARPSADGTYPSVVIIHHAPGWDEWTLEFAWKLAHHGFTVISPHLYSRYGPGDPDDMAARARSRGGTPDDQVMGDVGGAASFLRSQSYSNGKIGLIGFCSGGRQTFLGACSLPDINAAVDCWGGGVAPENPTQEGRPAAVITLASNISCPILGIFGNDDTGPNPEEVDRTEEELTRLGKTYEFYRYEGAAHAFMCTDRYRYRPEQAVDAWGKILAFFGRYLVGGGQGAIPKFIGPSPTVSLTGRVPLRAS